MAQHFRNLESSRCAQPRVQLMYVRSCFHWMLLCTLLLIRLASSSSVHVVVMCVHIVSWSVLLVQPVVPAFEFGVSCVFLSLSFALCTLPVLILLSLCQYVFVPCIRLECVICVHSMLHLSHPMTVHYILGWRYMKWLTWTYTWRTQPFSRVNLHMSCHHSMCVMHVRVRARDAHHMHTQLSPFMCNTLFELSKDNVMLCTFFHIVV